MFENDRKNKKQKRSRNRFAMIQNGARGAEGSRAKGYKRMLYYMFVYYSICVADAYSEFLSQNLSQTLFAKPFGKPFEGGEHLRRFEGLSRKVSRKAFRIRIRI